jgi:hypothetical protein
LGNYAITQFFAYEDAFAIFINDDWLAGDFAGGSGGARPADKFITESWL